MLRLEHLQVNAFLILLLLEKYVSQEVNCVEIRTLTDECLSHTVVVGEVCQPRGQLCRD